MTNKVRFLALTIAIAVNAAALAVAHESIVQVILREQLAQAVPERVVVTGPSYGHSMLAARTCPTPDVL